MQADQPAKSKSAQVIVLATGGTIAGSAASATQAGYTSGRVSVDAMIEAVPGLDAIARVRGEQVVNVGSQDMTFAIMIDLASRINNLVASDAVAGVVVTSYGGSLAGADEPPRLVLQTGADDEDPVSALDAPLVAQPLQCDGACLGDRCRLLESQVGGELRKGVAVDLLARRSGAAGHRLGLDYQPRRV